MRVNHLFFTSTFLYLKIIKFYIYKENLHKYLKNTLIQETYFMLKSVSQLTRPCVCLPLKDLNHDFQFSKSSVKKLLKG